MAAERDPDARALGAEEASYTDPEVEPQWIDAWKMFMRRDGTEFGVPVKLPAGQWNVGGPNALARQRRPDGGFWFSLEEPQVVKNPDLYPFECFVGECAKRLDERIKLVKHVRGFHADEAEMYDEILLEIERKVAQEDPRLQRVLASLNDQPVTAELSAEDEEAAAAAEACHTCGAQITGKLADHVCAED